ncbi:hypothetical protein X979_5855 [Burkholderia pseudomallei MSHR7527]|nr:hypothetical protein X979_5855 [Burkholderia pseudomallei MSHR7527]
MAESQDFSGRAHHATYPILNEFWEDAGSGVIVLFVQLTCPLQTGPAGV